MSACSLPPMLTILLLTAVQTASCGTGKEVPLMHMLDTSGVQAQSPADHLNGKGGVDGTSPLLVVIHNLYVSGQFAERSFFDPEVLKGLFGISEVSVRPVTADLASLRASFLLPPSDASRYTPTMSGWWVEDDAGKFKRASLSYNNLGAEDIPFEQVQRLFRVSWKEELTFPDPHRTYVPATSKYGNRVFFSDTVERGLTKVIRVSLNHEGKVTFLDISVEAR